MEGDDVAIDPDNIHKHILCMQVSRIGNKKGMGYAGVEGATTRWIYQHEHSGGEAQKVSHGEHSTTEGHHNLGGAL